MSTISRAAQFAERTARLRASTIREMLKVTQQPDVISFGGGLPAPELFPTAEIANATQVVMERYGPAALQYSVTEGIPEMRRWVADRLNARFDRNFESETVTIVNGSQQGLDLVGKIFLDPGDHVVLEDPSYLGAIQAFDAYQSRYLTVDTDEEGLIPESLERVLERADPFPKFLYLVPNFQNPTGRTLSRRRRELVVRICEHFGLPIVEDDPYGELRFEGEDLPSLISFETTAPIIYSGTASKIMAPGMRIAWLVIADEEIREKIVLAKQGADLHSGTFAQYVFHEYARDGKAFDAARATDRPHVLEPPRRDGRGALALHARRRAVHAAGRRHVSLGDGTGSRHDRAAAHLGPVESRFRAGRQLLSRTQRTRRDEAELFECLGEEYRSGRRTTRPRHYGVPILEESKTVADRLVVGIYPDTDPKALESALAAQQLDLSKIKVVGGRARRSRRVEAGVRRRHQRHGLELALRRHDARDGHPGRRQRNVGSRSGRAAGHARFFFLAARRHARAISRVFRFPATRSTTSATPSPTVEPSCSIPTPVPMRRKSRPPSKRPACATFGLTSARSYTRRKA